MVTKISIHNERVDDIPVLFFHQRVMGIPQIIGEQIEVHGNHQGLSLGWLVTGWLTYILSESDHRLSYVEAWAEERLQTLQALFPEPMEAKDFSDDRLGDVLDYLSQDESWQEIEKALGRHQIQVYQLPTEQVRTDSTSAAVYHEPNQESCSSIREGEIPEGSRDSDDLIIEIWAMITEAVNQNVVAFDSSNGILDKNT